LGAGLIVLGFYPYAVLCVALGGFMDGVDGALARLLNRVTKFGGALDSVLDRYGDALVIVAAWYALGVAPILGFFALAGSLITSYSRARFEAAGVSLSSVGLLERPERMIILLLTIIFNAYANYFFLVLAVLANFTVVQRVAYGRRALGGS
ncbi:MAG: CDP-alcohol phosphatidyltransferase family protein, partial [Thermoprotei archaeon]